MRPPARGGYLTTFSACRGATEANAAGADFWAGRVDNLDYVLHGLDEVGADL